MKTYDFNKAMRLIENTPNVERAILGLREDWFWTAETVYEDGQFKIELNDDTKICGINGSSWTTPTLQLCFSDGTEKKIEISDNTPASTGACERLANMYASTNGV